jgi:hypothetical protein
LREVKALESAAQGPFGIGMDFDHQPVSTRTQ